MANRQKTLEVRYESYNKAHKKRVWMGNDFFVKSRTRNCLEVERMNASPEPADIFDMDFSMFEKEGRQVTRPDKQH